MSNYNQNRAEIEKFRKQLRAMIGDISDIDAKVMTRAVHEGKATAVRNTPVGQYSNHVHFTTKDGKEVDFTTATTYVGGFMRRSWRVSPTKKIKRVVSKSLFNAADYASYVNDGHRKVNQKNETVGWVDGQFMLERAKHTVNKAMEREFKKEVERVNRKYDK